MIEKKENPLRQTSFLKSAARIVGASTLLGAVCFAGGDAALGAAPDPGLAPAQETAAAPKPSTDYRIFWKDGVKFETADKAFTAEFGGRIHYDWIWQSADEELGAFEVDDDATFDDGARFRRARMHIAGKMYEHMLYKIEFDFAGGSAGFRDVYLGTTLYDFATIKVGHFKEPFGLEQLTSSNNITFVERSLPDAFTPAFNAGAMVNNSFADERATWAFGVFRDTNDQGRIADNSGYGFTGRLTAVPLWNEEDHSLVHLGLSATHRTAGEDGFGYSSRPENNLAPVLVDVEVPDADDTTVLGIEAAWNLGSLSIQGEYMMADVSSDAADDPGFSGFYGMISYFITGERRPYRRSAGTFDRVRPAKNWGKDGCGAWELAARYSSIDLEDGAVDGGQLDDITGGVNWYLNPNARVMLNYVMAEVESGGADADANAVLLRFQVTF